jgi:molecular chaperone GrpE
LAVTSDAKSDSPPESAPSPVSADEVSVADAPADGEAETRDPPADPLEEAERRAASLKDQLLRTAADFENFRRRHRKELDESRLAGAEHLLKELLPVFDNLERATEHAEKATDVTAFASGIQMVMRQFHDTLRKQSIERVPTVGEPFDPNVHEAIQKLATAEYQPGHVAAEIQGGYRSGGRLIRPALVVVAEAGAGSVAPSAPPADGDDTASDPSDARPTSDSEAPQQSETPIDSDVEHDTKT